MLFFSDNSGVYAVKALRFASDVMYFATKCGAQLTNASSCLDPRVKVREYGTNYFAEGYEPVAEVDACSGANPANSSALNCTDGSFFHDYQAEAATGLNPAAALGVIGAIIASAALIYATCCAKKTEQSPAKMEAGNDADYMRLIEEKEKSYTATPYRR